MNHPHHHTGQMGPGSPYRLAYLFTSLFGIVRSGIKPEFGDPAAWYDRAIRIVGGLLIFGVFLAGLILLVVEKLRT